MQNKRTLNFGGLNTFDLSMFGKKLRNITIIFDISRVEFDNMKSFIKRKRYFKFRTKNAFQYFLGGISKTAIVILEISTLEFLEMPSFMYDRRCLIPCILDRI